MATKGQIRQITKEKQPSRLFTAGIVLDDSSPYWIVIINTKLVFQQMLFCCILPDNSGRLKVYCSQRRKINKLGESNGVTGGLSICHCHHSLKIKAHEVPNDGRRVR